MIFYPHASEINGDNTFFVSPILRIFRVGDFFYPFVLSESKVMI